MAARDGTRSGIVLECDGNQVYIEQDNGAESWISRATDLTAEPPANAAAKATDSRGMAKPPHARNPVCARSQCATSRRTMCGCWVRSRCVRLQAVAAVVRAQGPAPGGSVALDTAGKLNVIAEITAVPYRTMQL